MQTSEQHVVEPPDVQLSPTGRQPGPRSTSHWPRPLHESEQHSASSVQSSLSIAHSVPPHTPSLQASEQQSSAFSHATPSA